MSKNLVLACLIGAASLPAAPTPGSPSQIRIQRTPYAPSLEFLKTGGQPVGTEVSGFLQRQPLDGQPASQPTSVFLSYDDRNLYALFVCHDEPGQVRAHLSRREAISEDDKVGIALDTFHDGRRAYLFFSNPLGVQLDGITTEGQADDYKFDTVWRADGRLTDDGYAVLIAIPFRSLRFPRDGATWGIALTRNIRRLNEYSCWPYITDRLEAYVPQFAALTGLQTPHRGVPLEVTPHAISTWQNETTSGAASLARRELRGGVDARVILRDALTLDLTANPDFSQIETDEPQVTINKRYEVFFPEKRPFFLDNAGFFETPETLFFSRRLVSPTYGARLSGKVGGWAIGALAADDRAPGLLEGSSRSAQAGVMRVERELGGGSKLGVLFTGREFAGEANRVGAIDTRLKLNSNWVFTGQFARSWDRSAAETHDGNALYGDLRFVGRHLQYASTYRDRTPDFRADLGFIPRVDIRQMGHSAGYRWRPESGVLTSFGPSARTTATWDHQGRLQDWSAELPFWFQFRRATSLMVRRTEAFEFYRGRDLRTHGNMVLISSDALRQLGFTASLARGTAIDYYPAAGLSPRAAASTDASLELTVRPTGRLRIDDTYYYSALRTPDSAIFVNHLLRSKVSYQFTRSWSARAILDYNRVAADRTLTAIDPENRLAADFLLTWLLHPGTAVYAGYTTGRTLLEQGPGDNRREAFWMQRSRQVFVKLTYSLRL